MSLSVSELYRQPECEERGSGVAKTVVVASIGPLDDHIYFVSLPMFLSHMDKGWLFLASIYFRGSGISMVFPRKSSYMDYPTTQLWERVWL